MHYRILWISGILTCLQMQVNAQFLMDLVDTTKDMGKGMLNIYQRFDHIRMTGYIQPQFQLAEEKGITSFNGGNFAPDSKNRFMLRRGRLRFDYVRFNDDRQPVVQFVFQFDGTERGVFIRDFWGRVWDNRFHLFSLSTGMFARPFGYEPNLGSADRESPERGRMSQILMKTERDLGVMLSFEPRKRTNWLKYIKWDIGIFNGQGLAGAQTTGAEFDSYKDIITQLVWKSSPITKKLFISGGISYYNGGLQENSPIYYEMSGNTGQAFFAKDSAAANIGRKSPRIYYGANMQLRWKHRWGNTELRGEYWQGTQTATKTNTETPGTIPSDNTGVLPYYIRHFNGCFLYFLQNIVNTHHQLVAKMDWYDPNTQVKGQEVGDPLNGTTLADIRFQTFGLGYVYYMHENFKITFWYEWVKNEHTLVSGYTGDAKDNLFTCRAQYRF